MAYERSGGIQKSGPLAVLMRWYTESFRYKQAQLIRTIVVTKGRWFYKWFRPTCPWWLWLSIKIFVRLSSSFPRLGTWNCGWMVVDREISHTNHQKMNLSNPIVFLHRCYLVSALLISRNDCFVPLVFVNIWIRWIYYVTEQHCRVTLVFYPVSFSGTYTT